MDGSAAVFVPRVDGFGDDGIRVLLRNLPVGEGGEQTAPLVTSVGFFFGKARHFFVNIIVTIVASLTLQRNFAMLSGRLKPIKGIL